MIPVRALPARLIFYIKRTGGDSLLFREGDNAENGFLLSGLGRIPAFDRVLKFSG